MTDLANRRIIVTGGGGFLGASIVRNLHQRDIDQIYVPRSRDYDLTRQRDVERLFAEHPADVVVHAAAVVGGIGANQANPGTFYYQNLVMGAEMIEHARRTGVGKFVAIGTICSYPKHAPIPFQETDLWNGFPEETNAPYGIAKKAMAVQLAAYREEFGFSGIFLMPVNLYGPGDNFDLERSHVIPAMIRKFDDARESGEREVILWGDGTPTREFLYVEDAAEAIVRAVETYDAPEPMNIGSGLEIPIRELAETIRSLTGFEGEIRWDSSKPNGQPRRRVDTSRAQRLLGFVATTTLDEGLARTIEWYRVTKR
ncbi:MAG TPA: GDP-L-fucose synthase [Thermoanaerobaculia bacterium]